MRFIVIGEDVHARFSQLFGRFHPRQAGLYLYLLWRAMEILAIRDGSAGEQRPVLQHELFYGP